MEYSSTSAMAIKCHRAICMVNESSHQQLSFGGRLKISKPAVCVIFYFISRYMQPEGPWQLARVYTVLAKSRPRPVISQTGAPLPKIRHTKEKSKLTNERKNKGETIASKAGQPRPRPPRL